MKLIIYRGEDEVIVTTLEKEHEVLKLYFQEGGRDLEEYDREETDQGFFSIGITACINLDL